MQQNKIDNFCRLYSGMSFPAFKSLSRDECVQIRTMISESFRLIDSDAPWRLLQQLHSRASCIGRFDAECTSFDIEALLRRQSIIPGSHAYINWHDLDDIDMMLLGDLSQYFTDIWYPSSDDIEIFDESFRWIIFVDHDGGIGFVRGQGSDDSNLR